MPSQTFSHTELIGADLSSVWAALQVAETWGEIGGIDEITDATHDHRGHLQSYSFAVVIGGTRHSGTARTTEIHPPQHMKVSIDSPEMAGSIRLDLETSGQQTMMEVDMEVRSKGILSSMFFPVIASAVGSGLPRNVAAFARRIG